MFLLGWGVDGGAWRWRRRLFAWEEELVEERVEQLTNFVLQVDMSDRWVWRLNSSQVYTVHSTYSYLTAVDTNITADFDQFLWLKAVPLKVNIFVWRFFLNRLATKDNLRKRNVLEATNVSCGALCGKEEKRDHLFFQCAYYGRLWLMLSDWLGFVTVFNGNLYTHANQFCALGGFSKNYMKAFTIIWISVLYTIWKDRNRRIFQNQIVLLEVLLERVKLQTFWWLKANYILFVFYYSYWRKNLLPCLV
uniref:H+-transporting two-sector ATPase, alpha/beta subunit, central region, related n=1 Tax=Medicago truncatula TaxID=3880 RepID=Q2HTU8_MEDTR|nr:H+-transporting two-sector ATPase, alpha/beta subunit, central region, related [Medicago truncatula]